MSSNSTLNFYTHLNAELEQVKQDGLFKAERIITTAQQPQIAVTTGEQVVNFCANNYLGLANHPDLIAAAKNGLDEHGFGMASVRFICGTQDIHKQLETTISDFLGTQETILYPSCFDANGGLFETILDAEDAIISDSLNHASIIDGVRLCKAKRYRYTNSDMNDLEKQLSQANADGARFKIIVTDGVFSMEGDIAPLDKVTALARKYDALVVLDDSHGLGVLGATGLGVAEHFGVLDQIDIFTGTLGKALGAGTGGFVAGPKAVTETLIQKSRPHLFSNALPPSVAASGCKSIELLKAHPEWVQETQAKAKWFRAHLRELGLNPLAGDSAIVPVILGETATAIKIANDLLAQGIFVTGFGFPVVPEGEARLRFQISYAHSQAQLKEAASVLKKCLQSAGL